MHRSACLALLLSAGLSGCTALGAWVYDVPRFTVADIKTAPASQGGVSLEVTLTGCNINDYDLTADSLLAQLSLDGQPVSSTTYAAPFALPMRDSAQMIVLLHVADDRIRTVKGGSGDGGERTVPFAIHTVGTVQTPMGARLVDSWHRGTMRLKQGTPVAFAGRPEDACRPGTSVLPPAEGRGSGPPIPTVRQPELPPQMTQPRPEMPR